MNLNEKILTINNNVIIILYSKYYQCAVYVLNIAISHGIQLKVRIIDKVKTFINKIHYFTILYNALCSYCKVIKKDYLKPDFDNATR